MSDTPSSRGPSTTDAEHVHDWRIDPLVMLPTNPPRQRIVCLTCGDVSSKRSDAWKSYDPDPSTWDRWFPSAKGSS